MADVGMNDPHPPPAAFTPPGPAPVVGPQTSPTIAAPKDRAWVTPVGVGIGALAATAYTAVLNPNTSHAFPLCPLKYFTGYDCPLCGSLRAVHSLAHGDLVAAADHNVVFVAAVPFIVLAYLGWLGRSLGLPVPKVSVPPRVVYAGVIFLVLFAVARNIPALPGYTFLNSTAMMAGHAQ